ncbi:hypothetical protein FXO38_24808 [Capsicum annuum]|uniref:Uncharacterized protein n=1 Tax=Capsicum annuum TaxID=4072 RepID=A0A2G2ZG31_CAPAN|nr:hypothetical protein FXO38_24808 [Capsicum annuum]KAF3676635.1 hypothetical protein FXO37_05234 [Capsicum annuum]PHT80956.1 hypothetical protein T459_13971 [Capsicum annuum]
MSVSRQILLSGFKNDAIPQRPHNEKIKNLKMFNVALEHIVIFLQLNKHDSAYTQGKVVYDLEAHRILSSQACFSSSVGATFSVFQSSFSNHNLLIFKLIHRCNLNSIRHYLCRTLCKQLTNVSIIIESSASIYIGLIVPTWSSNPMFASGLAVIRN